MKKTILAAVTLVIVAGSLLLFRNRAAAPSETTKNSAANSTQSNRNNGFDKSMYPIDQPGSIWWVVNKKRPISESFVPAGLVVPNVPLRLQASSEQMHISKQIVGPVELLFASAKAAGYALQLDSGYRSYAYQKQLYGSYVAKDGQTAADKYSARPGTSEHQTGLALDVVTTDGKCQLDQCFGETAAGQWLAAHAYEYGFIIRYQKNKENVTGYEYEPWHLRFVGKELSGEMHTTGIATLEEFFGLPNYR